MSRMLSTHMHMNIFHSIKGMYRLGTYIA